MQTVKPRELLERVLEQDDVSDQEFNAFIQEQTNESQHHDFKSGKELDKQKPDRNGTLKEYVSAFGNTEGGVLIYGVNEKEPRQVDGCSMTETELSEWLSNVIRLLGRYFSPPPRWQLLKYSGSLVGLVGIPPSQALVPIVSNGSLVYWLRLGKSNFRMPESLIADLLLGRKQRSVLAIQAGINLTEGGGVEVELRLRNDSLVTAHAVRCGIVAWSIPRKDSHGRPAEAVRPYLELEQPTRSPPEVPLALQVFECRDKDVSPSRALRRTIGAFEQEFFRFQTSKHIQWPGRESQVADLAVFAMPEHQPPTWYQITLNQGADAPMTDLGDLPVVERPKVSWFGV